MESPANEMKRRSFLQLLAALPALGATGSALASLAPAAVAPPQVFTVFRFAGIEAIVRGISDMSQADRVGMTSLGDEFTQSLPREQIAGVEVVGMHPFPIEDGPFEIEGRGFLIAGHAEVQERWCYGGGARGDSTVLRMRPTSFEFHTRSEAA